jgi:hypothetical protein
MGTTTMTPEAKKQATELIKIGCATLCQGKGWEEVLRITETRDAVIAELNADDTPPAKPTRKKP